MGESTADTASIEEAIGDAANVLLMAPSMGEAADEGCARLLGGGSPAAERMLCVTLADTPDERLAAWRDRLDGSPRTVQFVAAGDSTRSTAATGASIDLPGGMGIETLSNPGDLTGLGMKMSEVLSDWGDDDAPIACCFHSLTTLLQYVEVQAAFRFLHVVTGRMGSVDAVAHYHLDPGAHDEQTVNTLASLFDAIVEHGDDGWTVRRR